MNYLPLYYKWLEKGEMHSPGLCASLGSQSILFIELFDDEVWGYWGYCGFSIRGDDKACTRKVKFKFTELRQNILLFMAAMNNEL